MRADPTRNPNADELKSKLQQAIDRGNDWLMVWDIFVNDLWYQASLDNASAQVVRINKVNHAFISDVSQDANILFGVCIRRNIDLGFDPDRGSFDSFVKKIVFRCCTKAAIQIQRRFQANNSGVVRETPAETQLTDDLLDLPELIEHLPETLRMVLNLYCLGDNANEIAAKIGKTERTVYRMLDAGILELQKLTKSDSVSKKSRSYWR